MRFTGCFFRAGVGKSITRNQIQPQPGATNGKYIFKDMAENNNSDNEYSPQSLPKLLPSPLQEKFAHPASGPSHLPFSALLLDSWSSPALSSRFTYSAIRANPPPPKGKPIELTAFSQLEEELFPRSFLSFPLLTSLGFHYVLWNGGGPPQAVGTRFSARYPKVEHSCENVHKPKWPSKEAITSIRMEKMVTIPRHEKAASLRFF